MKEIGIDFPAYPKDGMYLDSATKGLQPLTSVNAQYEFMKEIDYGVRKALHRRALYAENQYSDAKSVFGNFFNLSPDHLAWIPSADLGLNIAIQSLLMSQSIKKPRVITTVFEHHSILAPLLFLSANQKIELIILSVMESSFIGEYIENSCQEGDIFILGHITPTLGLVREFDEIQTSIKKVGGKSIFDFSRTAGQNTIPSSNLEIAVFDGSIDLLGPLGSGFLYVNEELTNLLHNPFPSSGNIGRVTKDSVEEIDNIKKFEIGTPQVPAMVGLTQSIKYLDRLGRENISNHREKLMKTLVEEVQAQTWLEIVDPFLDSHFEHSRRGSILTLKSNSHPHDLAILLDEMYNIQIRSGLICAHPSVTELDLNGVFQISTHVYNTEDEVVRLGKALKEIGKVLG